MEDCLILLSRQGVVCVWSELALAFLDQPATAHFRALWPDDQGFREEHMALSFFHLHHSSFHEFLDAQQDQAIELDLAMKLPFATT